MREKIEIRFEYCDDIFSGKSILTRDQSIVFEPSPQICSFSVHLYDWSFELTTQCISEHSYLICYALANLGFYNCETESLTIPKAKRGRVSIHLSFPHADGIYYSDYVPFSCKKYYDPQKKIYAVGDINSTGSTIEFANGQFAVIDELARLTTVYICLTGNRNTGDG